MRYALDDHEQRQNLEMKEVNPPKSEAAEGPSEVPTVLSSLASHPRLTAAFLCLVILILSLLSALGGKFSFMQAAAGVTSLVLLLLACKLVLLTGLRVQASGGFRRGDASHVAAMIFLMLAAMMLVAIWGR